MSYKIRKNEFNDILGCDCCGSEVATDEYDDFGVTKTYCQFCSESVGSSVQAVDKAILGQMMNTLYKKLNSHPKGRRRK